MKRVVLSALLLVTFVTAPAQNLSSGAESSGGKTKSSSAKSKAPDSGSSPAQPIDAPYTVSIIKNTTDKMFLTEIVDHLPASPKVPSPEKVLGYPIGTPNKLTYTKDQYRYYRELEKTTARV